MNACPACGTAYTEQAQRPARSAAAANSAQGAEGSVSSFLKYADFVDDQVLYNLAVCKLQGAGMAKNEEEAFEMFKVLAFRGFYDGMYKLAEMYLARSEPDKESACRWLKIAADGGHKPSIIKLKMMGADAGAIANEAISIPASASALEALVRNALPNIVLIRSVLESGPNGSRCSTGSGFIVEGGYVVTNAHVVGDSPECVTANFEPSLDSKTYNLMPLQVIPSLDVAILRFTGLADQKFTAQKNLTLRMENVAYGEEVYTIGNPLGMGLSVSRGVVSCPNRASSYPSKVKEVIQTDITANHGNSGGALLDRQNNVLGMITFSPGNSEGGIAMCVPSEYIVKVLNQIQ